MPKRVERVVSPWEPYLEGIWVFTYEEFHNLPRWVPSTDPDTGEIVGLRQYFLTIGDCIFVQFTTEPIHDWNAFWGMRGTVK